MLDVGLSLRSLLEGVAWTLSAAALVAWALIKTIAIAEGGIVLLTVACTLSILNDNARTRQCTRACMREVVDGRPGPLTQVR